MQFRIIRIGGPTFGKGSCDICICDKSNTIKNSYAYVGHSYSHPEYKYRDQGSWTRFSGAINGYRFGIDEW